MTRKTKAAWIGFLVPVVTGWGMVLYVFVTGKPIGGGDLGCMMMCRTMLTVIAVVFAGGPSLLIGGVIAAIAYACTKNKDPLKCFGCGYSLIGLTSGECPECGKKTP